MSATAPCVPCCSTPQTVNVPGVEGDPGDPGTNGVSAYSITTTSPVTVPAPTGTVSVNVNTTLWMVIGQIVIVGQGVGAALGGPGPSTFRVDSIPSASVVSLEYLGYAGDVSPGGGNTLSIGCVVSAAGDALQNPLPVNMGGTGASVASGAGGALQNLGIGYPPITVYGAGTSYVVTATLAQITLGTTSPITVLTLAGTYLIFYRIKLDYQGKTFAANHVFTLELEKINNGGPARLTTASQASIITPVITTQTYSVIIMGAAVAYTTAVNTDQIGLYAGLDVLPVEAGTVEISECEIVALKIY